MTNGKHLLAEFYHCQCADSLLCHAQPLLNQLIEAVQAVGLTLVGQAVHEFSDMDSQPDSNQFAEKSAKNNTSKNSKVTPQTSGITISLLLAESHLCIHTWGELKTVTLDIYVCNFLQDNSQKADALLDICKQLLQPSSHDIKSIWRHHQQ